MEYGSGERLDFAEYLDFLRRSDLGSMYPKDRFRERVRRLLDQADVRITAREEGRLVGTCFGLTDFAYFLFLTDLGVDRSCVRRGIGTAMIERAVEAAGGPGRITVVSWSNRAARPFYARAGLVPQAGLVGRESEEEGTFDVHDPKALEG